jgi:nitrogen-specific signal transduction histidine kinase
MKYKSKQLTAKLKGLDKSILDLIQILDEIPDNAPDDNGSWTITDDEGNEITLSERNGKVTITTTRKTLNLTIEVLDDKS